MVKGPPGQGPSGSSDERRGIGAVPAERSVGEETHELPEEVVRDVRMAARVLAEMHPGEETHELPGELVRDAVRDAVRAMEARKGAVPLPRDESNTVAGRPSPLARPRAQAVVARATSGTSGEIVVEGLDTAPPRGSSRPRITVSVRNAAGDLVDVPLDPAELARAFPTPAALGTHALLLGDAYRLATGARRDEAIDYLVRVFAGVPDAELGRAALLELGTTFGALDVYPLELVVHALDRYPWFLPTAGFGHVFSGKAARGGPLVMDTDGALFLEHAETMRVKSFAIVGGARPGLVFEPDVRPGRFRLELHAPGEHDVLVSGVGRTGYLVVDRLTVVVHAGARRSSEKPRISPPARDPARIAAWPVPPPPDVDPDDVLDAPAARAPEPTLLSHQELIARKAKRGLQRHIPTEPEIEDPAPEHARALEPLLGEREDEVPSAITADAIDEVEAIDRALDDDDELEDTGDSTMILSEAALDARPKALPVQAKGEGELVDLPRPSRLPPPPPRSATTDVGEVEEKKPKPRRGEATVIFADKSERFDKQDLDKPSRLDKSDKSAAPRVSVSPERMTGERVGVERSAGERAMNADRMTGERVAVERSAGDRSAGDRGMNLERGAGDRSGVDRALGARGAKEKVERGELPRLPPELAREPTRVMLDPSAPPMPVVAPPSRLPPPPKGATGSRTPAKTPVLELPPSTSARASRAPDAPMTSSKTPARTRAELGPATNSRAPARTTVDLPPSTSARAPVNAREIAGSTNSRAPARTTVDPPPSTNARAPARTTVDVPPSTSARAPAKKEGDASTRAARPAASRPGFADRPTDEPTQSIEYRGEDITADQAERDAILSGRPPPARDDTITHGARLGPNLGKTPPDSTMKLDASRAVRALDPTPPGAEESSGDTRKIALDKAARKRLAREDD